jgi:hypothetical protein
MARVSLPRPHAAQLKVIAEAARFNVLCCGRRWGKTTLGIDRLIQPALHGKPVAWYAPSYKLLAPVWREAQRTLREVILSTSQQERHLGLLGGGAVEMWSLDSPDSGRGRAYARVVIDEAALVSELRDAWEQSIRAQLTDFRGDAWFLSTPKGAAGYFFEIYNQALSKKDWAAWRMPSSSNPHLPADEIEAAKEDLTNLAFAQEYMAEFVAWEGAVFRRILDAVQPIVPKAALVIGVDWGRTNDYTCFVALSHDGHVVGLERFRGIEYIFQRQRLVEFWRRFGGRATIIAEVNSMGAPVVEQLQRDGLPVLAFTTTGPTKSVIIEALALAFERATIRIPNDPVLIGELQAYSAKPLPSGLMRYSAPGGMHDDTVMALAFAWAGLSEVHSQAQEAHRPRAAPVSISPV